VGVKHGPAWPDCNLLLQIINFYNILYHSQSWGAHRRCVLDGFLGYIPLFINILFNDRTAQQQSCSAMPGSWSR
jgi:hypothetical protein